MSDKILVEAYSKLKAIEEAEDPFCIGAKTEPRFGDGYKKVEEVLDVANSEMEIDADELDLDDKPNLEEDADRDDLVDGIEELTEIRDELFDITERLTDAIRAYAPDELRYWSSYGLAQLKLLSGSDEFMSSDENLTTLIKKLQEKLGTQYEYE